MTLNTKNSKQTNKQRLWVVTELYYPEETSTGYYLTKIAEGLAEEFDVKVICGQPNYSARDTTAPKKELRRNVEIFRVFGTRLDKNVIPFRVINMLTLSLTVFLKCLFKFRANDKILVVTTPPVLPYMTGLAAYLKRSRHILLIHDNYPEILFAVKKARKNSVSVKILNKLNRLLYNSAHKIIVVGRDMKKLISAKLAKSHLHKIYVIPNWAELETVSPAARESNALIKKLGLADKLIFLYAGNMGYPNDIESFLIVAEKLRRSIEFHFIFLGAGVKKKHLVKTVKSKQLKNITVLDSRPRSDQKDFLNACDVAIVSLVKSMWGVSMPSRTYNILAAGKPILALCEENSELDLVVREENAGWSIQPNEPDKLLEAIRHIANNRDDFKRIGKNARKAAVNQYTLQLALERYKEVIKIKNN